MLPLDDPRWKELSCRTGDASEIPDHLAATLANPEDLDHFADYWPSLCSEGTSWSAAYAAVPHILAAAAKVPGKPRLDYLYFIGLVAMSSCPECGEEFSVKPYLEESYRSALKEVFPLLTETLAADHDEGDTRFLLASIAGLKGHISLARTLNDNHVECQVCHEDTEIFDS